MNRPLTPPASARSTSRSRPATSSSSRLSSGVTIGGMIPDNGSFMIIDSRAAAGEDPDRGQNARLRHQVDYAAKGDGVTHVFDLGRLAAVLRGVANKDRPQRAATPADGIHQAGGGAPRPRLDGIEKRGENSGVVKALAEAEGGHGEDQRRLVGGLADEGNERRAREQSKSLNHHASAGETACKPVGKKAGQRHAY